MTACPSTIPTPRWTYCRKRKNAGMAGGRRGLSPKTPETQRDSLTDARGDNIWSVPARKSSIFLEGPAPSGPSPRESPGATQTRVFRTAATERDPPDFAKSDCPVTEAGAHLRCLRAKTEHPFQFDVPLWFLHSPGVVADWKGGCPQPPRRVRTHALPMLRARVFRSRTHCFPSANNADAPRACPSPGLTKRR